MKAFLPPNSSSMTACSSSSLPMALDMFRSVPTDCDIWDNWASWWFTRCSCCRICCWRSSWVELTLECDGEPVVANRLYFVFLVTFGNKLPWPEAEVGLDNDVMSVGTWKYMMLGVILSNTEVINILKRILYLPIFAFYPSFFPPRGNSLKSKLSIGIGENI